MFLLGWGWKFWRDSRLFSAFMTTGASLRPFQPTERHLQAIRKLKFTWSLMIESGGPLVDPNAPFGDSPLRETLSGIIGTTSDKALGAFQAEVVHTLVWALRNGTLPVGRYSIAPLTSARMREEIRAQLKGFPEERIESVLREVPSLSPDETFSFTADHQILVKHLRFTSFKNYEAFSSYFGRAVVAMINFKRPFGDMTAFEYEMADLLGRPQPETEAELRALGQLYWDMWPALQAFVQHAQIPTRG